MELERELADFARSFLQIGHAFEHVAVSSDRRELGRDVEHTVALLRALRRNDERIGIDRHAARMAFYAIVAFLATKNGTTPRAELELQFKLAPTDDEWRDRLGGEWWS